MITAHQDTFISDIVKDKIKDAVDDLDFVDDVIRAIVQVCDPEDIFPFKELAQWAEDHGYVKE